jgi:DNA-binding GntR family transcriptional regulator
LEDIQKLSAPPNLTALAYASIKRHLLEGKLNGDDRLTEEFLSKQLGISKSPIREALNGLQNEGLIRIEPRRGAYLRKFSIKEVRDLYNLRQALECYAVSIVKIDAELIEILRTSLKRTQLFLEANDKVRHIEEECEFSRSYLRWLREIWSSVVSLRTSRTRFGSFDARPIAFQLALHPKLMPQS